MVSQQVSRDHHRQQENRVSRLVGVLGLSALLSVQIPASVQASHISCGDTLGPGESFELDSDLVCPGPGLALTVDTATLDMKGFSVTCKIGDGVLSDGIVLIGTGAVLTRGIVRNCRDGVVLRGKGSHTIRKMVAEGNEEFGFTDEIDEGPNPTTGNTLIGNVAQRNGLSGFFFVWVTHSLFRANRAFDNRFSGIELSEDNHDNIVERNIAATNEVGFFVGSSSGRARTRDIVRHNNSFRNRYVGFAIVGRDTIATGNTAEGNGESGFSLFSGTNVADNLSRGNGEAGFQIFGRCSSGCFSSVGHQLEGNTAEGNGESGFEIHGADNTLNDNRALGNRGHGLEITADDSLNNTLSDNTAVKNNIHGIFIRRRATLNHVTNNRSTINGSFDLVDDNIACDSNTWADNTFGTRSQDCIH